MIRIICLGKIKEKYLQDAINDYYHRIMKYHKIEIIELKDDKNIVNEENSLLKYIDNKSYNIAMVITGNKLDSISLSKKINEIFNHYATINIFIGSSNGLSLNVLNRMDYLLSFGDITMPHGLFRLVLLEQIYRCFKINNNEKYHK